MKSAAEKDLSNVPDTKAEANDEYARQATNLVLEYLKSQKDQPDPELLKELNWTEDDLRAFLRRWEAAKQLGSSPDPEKQKQWTEQLRSLGLLPPSQQGPKSGGRDDTLKGLQDSGSRIRAPENLRKRFEAFRKAAQESDS